MQNTNAVDLWSTPYDIYFIACTVGVIDRHGGYYCTICSARGQPVPAWR